MTRQPAIREIAAWAAQVDFDQLPPDVIENTRRRVLDVIGLALAGAETAFGASVLAATSDLHPPGAARVWSSGARVSAPGAAFANAALAQALEFDDTHNLSVVHMSGPAVAGALALAESTRLDGRQLITAIAVGNEVSCRVGSVAPQQFHQRGFHPTGMFAPFGVALLAGRLAGDSPEALERAAGIVGSMAGGLLQCWVDGTQTKFLHPGWAAQSGLTAAALARAGATGPTEVLEGRWGLFAAHLQSDDLELDWDVLGGDLGSRWESENSSFKPYPVAHVIHPYIDAVLRLRREHGVDATEIVRVDCPVAPYQIGIVCEPVDEKVAPRSDSHGRVSLPFTLAEALVTGRIDRHSYSPHSLSDPLTLDLARRVITRADPSFPGSERFRGEVAITLRDGRVVSTVEEHNRGSVQNPLSLADIEDKFDDNAATLLDDDRRSRVRHAVRRLADLPSVVELLDLVTP